ERLVASKRACQGPARTWHAGRLPRPHRGTREGATRLGGGAPGAGGHRHPPRRRKVPATPGRGPTTAGPRLLRSTPGADLPPRRPARPSVTMPVMYPRACTYFLVLLLVSAPADDLWAPAGSLPSQADVSDADGAFLPSSRRWRPDDQDETVPPADSRGLSQAP